MGGNLRVGARAGAPLGRWCCLFLLFFASAISMTATKFSCLPQRIFAYPKTEKTGSAPSSAPSFPAPSKEITIAVEKVIEILISDSRYADVGLHDRPASSSCSCCHLLLRNSKTGSPKRVFKMFTLMKNYSSCHCHRQAEAQAQAQSKSRLKP